MGKLFQKKFASTKKFQQIFFNLLFTHHGLNFALASAQQFVPLLFTCVAEELQKREENVHTIARIRLDR
jgi:hypothetical protein